MHCAVLGTRAPGVEGSSLVLSKGSPPLGAPWRHLCNPCGQRGGRRGGSASSAATASARPGGEGGHSRRHAGGLRPCTRSASPGVGLAVVRSGAFSSAWASRQGSVFYVGAGIRHGCAPRPRAHQSRPPRRERSSLAVESVEGAGFLVTVGPGAHGTLRRPREAARWAAGSASPTYPAPRARPQRKGRFSRAASRRARLQDQAVQKRAPGGARCVHSGAHRRR